MFGASSAKFDILCRMIDIRKLKELVKLMVANDLSEMDLRDTDEQVTIRRQGDTTIVAPQVMAPVAIAPQAQPVIETPVLNETAEDLGNTIDSPMVGTYYISPNPDSPSFVNVGDVIDENTTVCIIEAMKIFNEIKARCNGTIVKILTTSGEPVEFGQPLFVVKPT